jgi:hypothetical protein
MHYSNGFILSKRDIIEYSDYRRGVTETVIFRILQVVL